MKEYSINLHLLLKGLHKEFPEKDLKTLKYWSLSNEATDSGSWEWKKKKTKKEKKKNKNWMCLKKMLHHVCLIPFCIIDMNYWYDSCKVFFKQRNNLLLSMLPQRVPDLDKKNPPSLFFFFFSFLDSWWVIGLFAFEPPYEETCNVSWTKMKKQNMILSLNSIRTSALLELMWIASLVKNITIQG